MKEPRHPHLRVSGIGGPDAMAVAVVVIWAIGAWQAATYGIWVSVGAAACTAAVVAVSVEGLTLAGAGAHRRLWPIGIAAGLVMAAATIALFAPVTTRFPALGADVMALYKVFGVPGRFGALVVLPLVVTCEEIVWRGAVHRALMRRGNWLSASAVGALIYAAVQLPIGSPALILTCLGAGFCWSALRGLTDSLPTTIAAHLVWNYTVLVVYRLVPAS